MENAPYAFLIEFTGFTDTGQGTATNEALAPLICHTGAPIRASDGDWCLWAFGPSLGWKTHSGKSAAQQLIKDIQESRAFSPQMMHEVTGNFVLIVTNRRSGETMLCNDKFATLPCYVATIGEKLLLSSSLAALCHQLPEQPALSKQSIYQYVYFHCIPAPDTVYEGISKLPCGHWLSFSEPSEFHLYHRPDFARSSSAQEDLQQALLDTLEKSVERAMDGSEHEKTGAFLSGGLDSSSVAGFFARKAKTKKAKTFTIGFHAEGYDESGYAKISADHFDTDHNLYYVTPEDVEDALPRIAAYYDEPFGNSSALPAYYCAKQAKSVGVELLLAGDGGDELFAGNERYAKQKKFECYFWIPRWMRKWFIEAPLSWLQPKLPLAILNKAVSYVNQANIRLPKRLQTYNFLHQFTPENVFSAETISHIDLARPQALWDERFRAAKGDTLDAMLYLDWKFTLADNDLVKVTNMCNLAGIDVRYPMLDDELVALSTRIPSQWKLPGTKLRHFYKKALEFFLPSATINKSKKGFGLPFGVWIRENPKLKQMAYDNVRSLKTTGLFKEEFLETAIEKHSSDHPGYYGELVWILMMLNLWLKAHHIGDEDLTS